MNTTSKAVNAMKDKGVQFDAVRLELAKKDANGIPQATGLHTLKVLRDERRTDIREYTGANSYKEVTGIRVWFDEGGIEKYYEFPLFSKEQKPHYLLKFFEEVEEGDQITLEYVKKGDKGFIDAKKVGPALPTIQLNESNPGSAEGDDEEGVPEDPDDIPF
jgi:hypothetical protein